MNRHERRAQRAKGIINKNFDNNLHWVCNDYAEPSVETLIPKHEAENLQEALENHLQWRSQFTVGLPMKSKELTVDELIEAGIVGLYSNDLTKFL